MTASPPRSPSAQRKPSVDVRALSLPQLHQAAQRGSRRARAEIERRLSLSPPQAAAPTPRPARVPAAAAGQSPAPPRPGVVPQALETPSAAQAETPEPHQALLEQWTLIERQALERSRLDGAPQLIGLLLLGWGALMAFGALVLLAYAKGADGGLYYLLCGCGVAAVGGLLLRRSRWALLLHLGLLLVAVGVVWGQDGAVSALVQASPVLLSGLWMLMASVREGLD